MIMENGEILFLNEKEIKQLVTAEQVFKLVETVLAGYANGDSVNPVKLHLPLYPTYEGYINSMPSFDKRSNLAGVKLVSVYKDNPLKYNIPSTLGTIILHHSETGMPYAIMGGTYITGIRTGAVAGVTAKYLARRDSKILTVVGAGAQGMTSLQMVLLAIPGIEEVRIVDIRPENRERIITKAKEDFSDIKYIEYDNRQEAFIGADIIVLATTASSSLLEDLNIDDGTTVICVAEILTPKVLKSFDRWIVDFSDCVIERFNTSGRQAAIVKGEKYNELTKEMVTGEIGDVIIGKTVGRLNNDEKVISAAVGMSIEDVIVARAAYDNAIKKSIGTLLPFQDI
jgi:ornithine cyclodeaminase/alanine dehydrogenase-like protein (mu-crystallin family)